MSADKFTITFSNEKIWKFYNENKTIDIEQANLLLIDLMQSIFNQVTNDPSTNVNAQILSFISENRTQIHAMKSTLDTIQENVSKMNTDIVQNMLIQFMTLKKDYIEDVRQIITNSTLTANEKLSNIMEKNTSHLLDKTTLLLNDVLPKNQEHYSKQVQDALKDFHAVITEETNTLVKSSSQDKSFQDFITMFDAKYASIMQTIQTPIFSLMTASEERIQGNIEKLKESASVTAQQSKIFEDLGEFLGKYKVSSNKGKYGEQNLSSVLNSLYPSAEVRDTTGLKASGDFIMRRLDKPVILFETKEYDHNMTKDEIAKFIRDIDTQNINGIFMSQYSGISFKHNFQIDIHKGNVLVYIQNCEYSLDKIKLAVDIIDHLSVRIKELNLDHSNRISDDMLHDINQEYQAFISQKEALATILKDFNKKMSVQIEDLKMPVLDKYLEPKYGSVKSNIFTCDICGIQSYTNKQSLAAHKRGCAKKTRLENAVL